MQGDAAAALGIHPPHSVRIDMDGWAHNWPHQMVSVEPDAVIVSDPHYGNRIVRYPYVHASENGDGTWRFVGEQDDFTVSPGPAPEPSMDTAGPAGDDWPYDDEQ